MRLDQELDSAPVEFDARVVSMGTRSTLVVRGEVDRSTAPGFAAVVHSAIRRASSVELDLRDLRFMDSAGVKVLVDVHLRLGQIPEAVVLRDPPSWLCRLLRLLEVDSLFTLRTTSGSGS
jgi:phospholipid transport system transporter-binding protein